MTSTQVEHSVEIAATKSAIYSVISDVALWPLYFPPTVRAERLSGDASGERIRIWAVANGELRTWVSSRKLDETAGRIEFEQTEPRKPVAAMSGVWQIEEHGGGGCTVVLEHNYRATDDDPADLACIALAVETNSVSELAALKLAAQRQEEDELLVEFEDVETIACSVEEAYDFVYDIGKWPELIPHVLRMDATEKVPGLQYMEMDTKSPDGSVHTTQSGRVCLPADRIVYKQTRLPGVLQAHTGEWLFHAETDGRTRVTSQHRVILDPDAIAALPIPPKSMAEARTAVRNALGANSRATMATAKVQLEAR